jgi:hypothetical protein
MRIPIKIESSHIFKTHVYISMFYYYWIHVKTEWLVYASTCNTSGDQPKIQVVIHVSTKP